TESDHSTLSTVLQQDVPRRQAEAYLVHFDRAKRWPAVLLSSVTRASCEQYPVLAHLVVAAQPLPTASDVLVHQFEHRQEHSQEVPQLILVDNQEVHSV